jgi:hypothetical protein
MYRKATNIAIQTNTIAFDRQHIPADNTTADSTLG